MCFPQGNQAQIFPRDQGAGPRLFLSPHHGTSACSEEFRGSAEFLLLKRRNLGVMCWLCCLRDVWDGSRSSILPCCVPQC